MLEKVIRFAIVVSFCIVCASCSGEKGNVNLTLQRFSSSNVYRINNHNNAALLCLRYRSGELSLDSIQQYEGGELTLVYNLEDFSGLDTIYIGMGGGIEFYLSDIQGSRIDREYYFHLLQISKDSLIKIPAKITNVDSIPVLTLLQM